MANEQNRLTNVEKVLCTCFISRDATMNGIAHAIQRLMCISRLPHPITSMFFCGPTGVEKFELTKALVEHYFGSVSIWYSCKIWLGLSFLRWIPIYCLINCCDNNAKNMFK
jgi:ATP-dependent Clp protease ATP-binding subunit ClpA